MTTDTKSCAHCGETIERRPNQSAVSWATKKYCCRRCAALATNANNTGRPKSTGPVQTKQCAWCGETFSRPYGMHNRAWEYRRFCCQSCAGKAHHHGARTGAPPITELCDCGHEATMHVWVTQGSADGRLTNQRVCVCADCVEMWVQDGATLKRPPSPKGARCWAEQAEDDYHATAHMALWHMTKGARP